MENQELLNEIKNASPSKTYRFKKSAEGYTEEQISYTKDNFYISTEKNYQDDWGKRKFEYAFPVSICLINDHKDRSKDTILIDYNNGRDYDQNYWVEEDFKSAKKLVSYLIENPQTVAKLVAEREKMSGTIKLN